MIRLAALDIAGTTVQERSAVYGALHEAVAAAGARPSERELAAWTGAGKREAITALLAGPGGPAPDPARVDDAYADFRARLAAAYRAHPPVPLPGVEAALAALRAGGVKVALTTGFDREVTTGLLAQLGWEAGPSGPLDAVVCVDDVAAGRPAPDLVLAAMAATGVDDAADVLVAGDTVRDLQAGTRAGAALVVGVLTGADAAADLEAAPHTHVVASVADLPALLGLG